MSAPLDFSGNDLKVNTISVGSSLPGQTGSSVISSGGSLTPPAGTATVAPLVLASGTNLTTPTAGSVEFDGTAFYATSHNSSRAQMDTEQYLIQATDFTLTDGTTAQKAFNQSTNGAITLTAGKTYFFEACYNITNTGITAHTWAVAFGGTATFGTGTAYQAFGISGGTANTPAAGGLSGFFSGTTLSTATVVTASSTSATEQVAVELIGTIVVSTGGTLIPQVKLSAATTGTEVMKAGSFFRIWEAGTLGTVGNWS